MTAALARNARSTAEADQDVRSLTRPPCNDRHNLAGPPSAKAMTPGRRYVRDQSGSQQKRGTTNRPEVSSVW